MDVRRLTSAVGRSAFPYRRLFLVLFLIFNATIILLPLSVHEPTRKWVTDRAQDLRNHGAALSEQWNTDSPPVNARRDCRICSVAPALCEEYGASNVARAMSFMGSGERMRRFLVKARAGKGFDVGVIGGSVSRGHGIKSKDPAYSPNNAHRIIFNHLNELFPAPEGSDIHFGNGKNKEKNGFVNGAKPATGSKYFGLCYGLHIPESVDLVLVELGVNDLSTSDIPAFELMIRTLLDLPDRPAIINLQVLALQFAKMTHGNENHLGVVQYYDLPNISLKNMILPSILEDDDLLKKWFHVEWVSAPGKKDKEARPDLRHMSVTAHQLLGNLTNAYIDSQLCELEDYESVHGPVDLESLTPQPLPRLLLEDHYQRGNKTTPKLHPQCFAAMSDIHRLRPIANQGWREWSWKWKHYLIADEPGSRVSFKITTVLGKLSVSYLRSREFGFGMAKCWVDDREENAKRLDGYWTQPQNVGQTATIAENLSPGEHQITCESLKDTNDPNGATEFRLISIMSI